MTTNSKRKSDQNESPGGSNQASKASSSKVRRKSSPLKHPVASTSRNGDVITENGTNDAGHISDDEEGGMRIGDIYIPPAPRPALSMDATGPRLLITHIVNENFKSYYGKQTLGPFHKSFTAIIGPNGSGKSNVIDSMLFVFGYRSSKIRSKKLSEMLHKSSQHMNVSVATVSVHFVQIIDNDDDDNENGYEEVPNSHIIVSRTVSKDNSSFYMLNGKRVQFKEVAKMLKSHGIDLDHNRFLILQGEVESIAMMKSKAPTENETGLLEYLDDIIGTSRFKEPLVKLNIRVEELAEMRKEKLNRVRLVENEKQKLEQPMLEAMEHLKIVNNLSRMRNTLLQKYIYETTKIINEKTEEVSQFKEELKQLDAKLKEAQSQKEEKQNFLKVHNQKYDKLKERKEKLLELSKSLKNRDGTIHADSNQANKRKKNVQNLLHAEKGKLIELNMVPEKNRKEIAECERLEQKHKKQKEDLDGKLQALMETIRVETEGLQDQKDKVQAKLIGLKKTENETNMKLKLAESELKIYMRNEVDDKAKFDRLVDSLASSTKALAEKKVALSEVTQQLPNAERELSSTQRKLEAVREDENRTSAEARRMRAQLEESRQAMTLSNSKNKVLDFIMKQRQNGRLPGVFGRLGDLGGIDTKYDVAISTCCGALDNILVDTVETAKNCIEMLKQHNVGRATFIALEKQEHLRQQAERKITTPENVPRLFDLIKVTDPRVKPAFYFVLRDTIVAKDLEQATRIAYGRVRYRVVSVNGDLIEIAGTMSGGGHSTMRGRMGTCVKTNTSKSSGTDPSVLAAQERKVEEMEARLPEVRNNLMSLEDKLSTLTKKVNDMRMEKSKLEIEVKHLNEQLPTLKSQLKEQEARMKRSGVDPKQKAKLENIIEGAKEVFNTAKNASGKLEAEVKEIQAQITAASGGQLQKIQKSINEVNKNIDKVRSEVTKLNVAISASARNVKKTEEKIGHMETDIKEIEVKLAKLHDEKKTITLEAVKVEKELDEIEESLDEDVDRFSGVKDEIVKLQKDETKMKSERLDLVNNANKVEKTVADHKSKIPVWKKEISTLKLEDPDIQGIARPAPLGPLTDEELEAASVDDLRNKCNVLKDRVGDKQPNLNAVQEYRAKEQLYLKRTDELEEITKQRNDMRTLHDSLKKKRHDEFMQSFSTITAKLKEMYQMITLGGDAELELVDSMDPFAEGIIFSVRPPNKSWKNISNLSGGEKTLSSLALVFALHYFKPSPLYVMDEIDAALDFKNVSIVANYIKERTKNAQFIIISLRENMFELSNILVGIYKTEDCTKSIPIPNRVPEVQQINESIVV